MMFKGLFSGTILGFIAIFSLAASSRASPSEPVTVDVYGSSYSVELEYAATHRLLSHQPWWGKKRLAGELCEALVEQGTEIANVGFNVMEISGKTYIEAYLVMPSATCSGPVVISPEDIGESAGGTFVVVSNSHICLTDSSPNEPVAQLDKNNRPEVMDDYGMVTWNCSYFNYSMVY
ncbi:hypothetical protein [Leptothoe kymatousa]|uniref:Uncharacterized protein n=1 Tax=Leptothoe kymatousa TAU-MAC 1615 TaxID=2364775 RepID=A0ABS5Y1R5_9CYAN|nr:hypothetical protein [Leptothoe kymatousa]MBT9311762.1 hypothetical protein [Leptothoe kymatousa TAU-MAC 1615]